VSETKPARPPQVTLAGWLVVGGSVIVVLMAFSQVGDLRSLQTRESIEEYLSRPPGDALGLSVSTVQTLLRVALMVGAATATATAILGWHALQRNRAARVALTVLAVPLFLSGMAGGGFASAVVSAAIVMLWFQPARDWFDGRSRPVAPALRETPSRDPLLDLPPPSSPPLHPTPYAGGQVGRATARATAQARPPAVTWACILTWLFSFPAALLFAATVVVIAADPDQLVQEMQRQNPELADQLTESATRTAVYVIAGGVVAWSLAAAVVAVLVWRRVPWAAVALMASAGAASLFCLVCVLASIVLVIPMAACAAALALLLRPESRAWFSRR
jgi:hypothetical protein